MWTAHCELQQQWHKQLAPEHMAADSSGCTPPTLPALPPSRQTWLWQQVTCEPNCSRRHNIMTEINIRRFHTTWQGAFKQQMHLTQGNSVAGRHAFQAGLLVSITSLRQQLKLGQTGTNQLMPCRSAPLYS